MESGAFDRHPDMGTIRRSLSRLRGDVVFQWVPGHCGLLGNELADQAAKEATTLADDDHGPVGPAPVSYQAARALLRRVVTDSPPSHDRVRRVYTRSPKAFGQDRKIDVKLAQLRSGHSKMLAAYRQRLAPGEDPTCPRCGEEEETLEHWLQRCVATEAHRMRCFGTVRPPLAVLVEDPGAVALYLRSLRLL